MFKINIFSLVNITISSYSFPYGTTRIALGGGTGHDLKEIYKNSSFNSDIIWYEKHPNYTDNDENFDIGKARIFFIIWLSLQILISSSLGLFKTSKLFDLTIHNPPCFLFQVISQSEIFSCFYVGYGLYESTESVNDRWASWLSCSMINFFFLFVSVLQRRIQENGEKNNEEDYEENYGENSVEIRFLSSRFLLMSPTTTTPSNIDPFLCTQFNESTICEGLYFQ